MSAKNSKFSGIFAQAREREESNPPEKSPEIPGEIGVDLEDESAQIPSQEPPKTAQFTGESAPKKPISKPKTSSEPLSKAAVSPAKTLPKVADEGAKNDSATPLIGRPKGKRSDPNFTQITAYISKKTHQNVKLALLNEGQKREISELIEDQLVAWLDQKGD